ncbi:DUF4280 domain-containing protein [Variovorax sp. KK3]|uniref:DUF4280 domain-containing protein n=1 Tax=Variovorax sp. KK3 TaxID=1855728 RepID=UPI00097BED6F|nr:DUF4280 domain-containing protein [Variovorax sp. KK3]
MPMQVCTGAQISCSMGLAPSVFTATPMLASMPAGPPGHVQDNVPFLNIAPFGMCRSPANPAVASATAAASGVLTPMPCVPVTPSPWVPGATKVKLGGLPALHDGCTLQCIWGGAISVVTPGQTTVEVT